MIVLPEDEVEPGAPNERTPLKSPAGPSAQSPPSYPQAPPPYAPTSPISPISPTTQAPWRPGPPLHSPTVPLTPQWPQNRAAADGRALRRLFTAWIAAWVVIFLWGMFVGTVHISVNEIRRENPAQLLSRWWDQGGIIALRLPTVQKRCNCTDGTPTTLPLIPVATPTPPLRPLPIDYPLTILREAVTEPQPEDTAIGTF